MGLAPSDVFTVQQHFSFVWRINSGDNVKKSSFPSAVGTNQSRNTPLLDRKGGIFDRADAAKVFVQVLNDNQMSNRRQKKTARRNPGRN
jgi:hypothetical protein